MNIRTPSARGTDPESSHLAAERITQSGKRSSQQDEAVRLVTSYPGHTAAELAEFSRLDRYQLSRRLPEIERIHVHKGSMRECRILGSQCVTWWPL
jgi:hypothetical protein